VKTWLVPLILATLLNGCASLALVEQKEASGPGYTVELPLQWMRVQGAADDQLIITHDGFGLQRISIAGRKASEAFPKLKKAADEKLLPSELAELHIAELKRSGQTMSAMRLMENGPALIGGRHGFRIHVQYHTTTGLRVEEVHYGVVQNGNYYIVAYSAPSLYYFPKYLSAFNDMVSSFRLL
jgi:hypothetical protein